MLPSKVVPLEDSVLLKLPDILDRLEQSAVNTSELYQSVKTSFQDINEYIFALDILFVLNAIRVTDGGEVTINAEIHTV